ncbi:SusC/RagA family TonB-linked outer membrane protein [Pseudochryseolinea flava]|uniref:SusC/RagA family TonB-linked outer membrane protein n=1 Tax=Pseudochryseolinea flava TaxID=2059302 RepID=A0A364XZ76_9BACT|nr:SusC/RagA family TonB-linked outer membrane protein [Pseudochryseolinea flava]RAV98906.1 SusC/RagA family TonB-linked outer membrane protein [Pseudochryseolinea flava]
MRKLYALLISMLFFLACEDAWAGSGERVMITNIQQQAITGQVLDESSTPLPGVNVLVRGSTGGTVTDAEGNFSLTGVSADAVLVFSFIGFKTKEVSVNGQTVINVSLDADVLSLDEVVVTALGVQKESKKLGYAVTSVKTDELINNRTTNVMESLEGKVAGLNISPPAAGAGASMQIRLRGQAAFAGANNAPLIVINGLPMDQGARSANGNGAVNQRDRGDNLQNINPDDIESLTVLKGSTAAAIYGARAANGAIIITTKSGGKDQGIGIDFTSSYTSSHALNFLDEITQTEYGAGRGGVRPQTLGDAQSNGQFGFGERLDGKLTMNFDGVERPYSAYKDRLFDFLQTGSNFTNTLGISGSGANGSFRVSFSNTDAKGIVPMNEYKKRIFNVGINHNLTSKLSLQLNVNYAAEQNINPPQIGTQGDGAINFFTRMSISTPLIAFEQSAINPDTDAEFRTSSFLGTVNNPYFPIQKRQFFNDDRNRLLATATLRYKLTEWLYIQGRYNFDRGSNFMEWNQLNGSGAPSIVDEFGKFRGRYDIQQDQTQDINADFLVGGNKEFGKFSVDASVGGNTWRTKFQQHSQYSRSFTVADLYTLKNGTITWLNEPDVNLQNYAPYVFNRTRINSLYGWAEFGYNGLAYINFTGRQDWFSVLNPDDNSVFYPSVSGSFIFSELLEEQNWLSYGKFRASWAKVGSANGVNPYDGILNYIINPPFSNQATAGLSGTLAPNPLLRPFTVVEKEVGVEMRLFNNRLLLDIGAFDKVTTDQILEVAISSASGFNNTKQNKASLQNRGLETLIEATPIQGRDFSWTTSWNNAYLKTEVLDVGNESGTMLVLYFNGTGNEFLGELRYTEGLAMNQLYTRTYRRNANGQVVVDANGRLLETTPSTPGAEKTNGFLPVGSSIPKHVGGWNNTLRYKNLSLGIHIDYKFGGTVLSSTHLNMLRQGHSKLSLQGRREGENGIVFPAVYEASGEPNTTAVTDLQGFYADYRNKQIGDPFVFKSDFIKLRNISISYNFTTALRKVSALNFIKALTLTAGCRNVAILYKDLPGLDPESVQSSGDFRAGYENAALPTTRNYNLTLNARF